MFTIYILNRGSNASLSPSPNKLNPKITMVIHNPGISDKYGCVNRYPLECESILPQLGAGGGTPSPRKLKDASVRIAVPN